MITQDNTGDSDAIVALSRQRIEKGSRSFAVAARLFDVPTRASAYMLYAWCRYCDDVVDGQELGFARDSAASARSENAVSVVDMLDRKTREALSGSADEPEFVALSRVVRQHAIPDRHPLELIDGFRMDANGQHYETIEQTLTYCYHVAGVVGVMMAMIMGVRDRAVLDRASDLGIAFQLTNISRDVIADAKADRIYLPAQWLRQAGISPENLADPANREAVAGVVARLLDLADAYYASAAHGMPYLPLRSAWAVGAASSVYRAIGTLVRKRGAAAWDTRTSTSRARKIGGVAAGLMVALKAKTLRRGTTPPARLGLWTMPADERSPGDRPPMRTAS